MASGLPNPASRYPFYFQQDINSGARGKIQDFGTLRENFGLWQSSPGRSDHLLRHLRFRQIRIYLERGLQGGPATRNLASLGVCHGEVILPNNVTRIAARLFQVPDRRAVNPLAVKNPAQRVAVSRPIGSKL